MIQPQHRIHTHDEALCYFKARSLVLQGQLFNDGQLYASDRTLNGQITDTINKTFWGRHTDSFKFLLTDYSLNVYTGEYEASYAANFTNAFAGNYLDDFEGTFTREFSSTYSHTPEYTGDLVVTQYEGVYEKDFLSVYISENVQNYTSVVDIIEADYSVAYSTDYDGTYESSYSENFLNIDGELGDGSGSDLLVPSGSDRLVLSDSLIFRVVAANTGVEGSYISDDAQLTSTPIILETYTLYARVA